MRTSPPHVRPRSASRAPALVLAVGLILGPAACGSDGGSDAAPPSTTAPATTTTSADETTTTTSGGSSTPDPDGTTTTEPDAPASVPGDDADVLTVEEAEAQIQALINQWRSALIAARAAGALDERAIRALAGAFTLDQANAEITAISQNGGVDIINPTPRPLTASDVELTSTSAGCAAGTAVISGADDLVTTSNVVTPPHYFKLVPAPEGASAPGWRLGYFSFSTNGAPLEVSCT